MKNTRLDMKMCEQLWNECEPALRKACAYKLSNHPQEIDDVIGDTFLALCNAISNEVEIYNPRAWLQGTLNNVINNKYREINFKQKKHTSIDCIEQGLFYVIDFDNLMISEKQILEIKSEICNQLLASEKMLLILIYTKKLKMAEIAVLLGSTESAVKQRHYRLKRKIVCLADEKINEIA